MCRKEAGRGIVREAVGRGQGEGLQEGEELKEESGRGVVGREGL